MIEIMVVGSINMDLVVRTVRAPKAGETVHGSDFKLVPGGKGANQAVAASLMGASTMLIGCVGQDAFGPELLAALRNKRVNVEHVKSLSGIPTGTATIIVEDSGENRIVVVPGTNAHVSVSDVEAVAEMISSAKVVILQYEIPLESVARVIDIASHSNCQVVLNAAPAYPTSQQLLSQIDTLIVNESEAKLLSGIEVFDLSSAFNAADKLRQQGAKMVIVTLGSQGAILSSAKLRIHVSALAVKVVDTTAAGDAFVGGFAASLVKGRDLLNALKFAVSAGSLATTKLGAQPSIPQEQDVLAVYNSLEVHEF